jgi:HAD superfamily hydrolase (TIGR01509 family)
MRALTAVVFDFDGIVLDSETPEFEAHRQIFERCGVELTAEEWCGQIGLWSEGSGDAWFARLRERAGAAAPDRAAFNAEKRRLFDALVPLEPMRGIRTLLDALTEVGVPAALATSSPAGWVLTALDRLDLGGRFRAVVTGTDVARRKPAPDVYLEAARRLGAAPAAAVAIEDSGPGLAAARAAGMRTVVIPHRLTAGHDLAGADLRIAHAGELTVERLDALCAPSGDAG